MLKHLEAEHSVEAQAPDPSEDRVRLCVWIRVKETRELTRKGMPTASAGRA